MKSGGLHSHFFLSYMADQDQLWATILFAIRLIFFDTPVTDTLATRSGSKARPNSMGFKQWSFRHGVKALSYFANLPWFVDGNPLLNCRFSYILLTCRKLVAKKMLLSKASEMWSVDKRKEARAEITRIAVKVKQNWCKTIKIIIKLQ